MADYRNWQYLCVYRGKGKEPNVYSGIGPGNTGILLYGSPDLDVAGLAQLFADYGGRFGENVQWKFQEKGQILLSKRANLVDEGTIVLEALGSGAEDVLFDDGDLMEIRTRRNRLQDVADVLELEDVEVLHAGVVWMPRQAVPVEDAADIRMLTGLLEEVLRLQDVWNITSDFVILDEKLEKLTAEPDWDA